MLNCGVVDWKSAKQSTIVMSFIEVKYIVVAEASMEVWMSKFIDGLGNVMPTNKEPIKMVCDNIGAIATANDPGIMKGARHYQRKYYYIQEVIENGNIVLNKVLTDDNLLSKLNEIDEDSDTNSDSVIQSNKIDDLMKEEVKHLQVVIDALHVKHKEYNDIVQIYCRLIRQKKLIDALALSDRCLRDGASDHLLMLLIEREGENHDVYNRSSLELYGFLFLRESCREIDLFHHGKKSRKRAWLRDKKICQKLPGHNLSRQYYPNQLPWLTKYPRSSNAAAELCSSNSDTGKIMARMDVMTMKMDAQYKDFQSRSKQSNLDDDDIPMSHEEEAKFMQTFLRTRFYNDYCDRDSNRDNWRSSERNDYNRDNYQSHTNDKPDLQKQLSDFIKA
ncbi:hypothetical protein Tco_1301560 [Tanacetum coccineum]